MLVPFIHEAPPVELGVLAQVLQDAPAAFPLLLSVGRKVEQLTTVELRPLQERVTGVVDGKLDSRLCTHYCVSIICAQEVCD